MSLASQISALATRVAQEVKKKSDKIAPTFNSTVVVNPPVGGGDDSLVVVNSEANHWAVMRFDNAGIPAADFNAGGSPRAFNVGRYSAGGAYIDDPMTIDLANGVGSFQHGLRPKVKSGLVTDTDFPATPPDGTFAFDSANGLVFVRRNGQWHSTKVGRPVRAINGLRLSNGGLGGTVATSLGSATAGSARWIVKLPKGTTRWRLHLRNRDYDQAAKTAATLKRFVWGTHAMATTGTALETGNFVGNTATTVVSTDQTIPGDGNYYTSPWVNGEGEVLIGIAWTFTSLTALQTGAGRAWHWGNATSATDPTVTSGSAQTYIPFDWIIEPEVVTTDLVTLVVGDSIGEGCQGSNSALLPTTLRRNFFEQWAERTGRTIVNLSLAGIALSHFATTPGSNYLWTRRNMGSSLPHVVDEVVIQCGSNDFNSGRTLANMQAGIQTIVGHLRNTLGFTGPIYVCTLIARGTTGDAVRVSYNEWVSQFPSYFADVVDFDGTTRGTTSQNLVDQYTPDNIHLSWLGNKAVAEKLISVLPS